MKTVIWIACGLGLNIAAVALHGGGASQAIMDTGLAGTLPKLLMVAAGNICIWRGLRSALADLWGVATGKTYRKPQGGSRFAEDAEPLSDFDADAAFERYMQHRKAREEAEPEPPAASSPSKPVPARAPAAQGGFGRKVV
ncbi:MAG: hypothetical protein NBV68_01655 [Erythrobacter sp.]|uniref:hypothetical protein n=1 Tax=Erythrobacter sp. TaxID=1042 RepID=UPI0025D68359|nr:hypothetical protein [Erythrobacter sp.]MCL9998063.1 hypothetical protein [Erythrobacter sp.]